MEITQRLQEGRLEMWRMLSQIMNIGIRKTQMCQDELSLDGWHQEVRWHPLHCVQSIHSAPTHPDKNGVSLASY